jgi:hypothetical protein
MEHLRKIYTSLFDILVQQAFSEWRIRYNMKNRIALHFEVEQTKERI